MIKKKFCFLPPERSEEFIQEMRSYRKRAHAGNELTYKSQTITRSPWFQTLCSSLLGSPRIRENLENQALTQNSVIHSN